MLKILGVACVPVRVLLLSAEFGSGHQAAANAIADACRSLSAECEAVVVQCQSPLLGLFSRAYLWQIKHVPALYRKLYHLPVGWPLRLLVVLVLGGPVRRIIKAHQPDVIVGTHPFPAGAAVHLLNRPGARRIPVVMALTDFAPHGFWIWKGVARYCCASPEAAAELVRRGADARCVTVTGVPVRASLAEIDTDSIVRRRTGGVPLAAPAEQARNPQPVRAGSDTPRKVLVMGGGLGLGPIADAVGALLTLPHGALQVTVICGRNRALQEQLTRCFGGDPRLTVLGYTDRVIDHMCDADLLVTKPGGITCAEALALGLPMLLLDPLPGHEEENARYLVETGAARIAGGQELAAAAGELLFAHPDRLAPMAEAARLAGQPAAARAIAGQVMHLAGWSTAG
nr:glycosyltransferase [Symbiobacterium terraclitae]